MIFLRIGRFWVKKKNSEKNFLVTTFSKSGGGGGYLGAKNQNFKNCSEHDFLLRIERFWVKNNKNSEQKILVKNFSKSRGRGT